MLAALLRAAAAGVRSSPCFLEQAPAQVLRRAFSSAFMRALTAAGRLQKVTQPARKQLRVNARAAHSPWRPQAALLRPWPPMALQFPRRRCSAMALQFPRRHCSVVMHLLLIVTRLMAL